MEYFISRGCGLFNYHSAVYIDTSLRPRWIVGELSISNVTSFVSRIHMVVLQFMHASSIVFDQLENRISVRPSPRNLSVCEGKSFEFLRLQNNFNVFIRSIRGTYIFGNGVLHFEQCPIRAEIVTFTYCRAFE